MSLQTARIPELPSTTAYGGLTLDAKIPVYLPTPDKTVWASFQEIYELVQTGGSGSIVPVIIGNKIIHDVTALEENGVTISIPSLAGKNFFLTREGRAFTPSEYEILNAGGFKLTVPGDVLLQGQRYVLEVYELQASGSGNGGPVSAGASLFNGTVTVTANSSFNVTSDLNKVIRLRGGSVSLTYTLPLLADVPENLLIVIESLISNEGENTILTQGGQYIYLNNTGINTGVRMRAGEVIWLFRGADGYYVVNDFGNVYNAIGSIQQRFKAGLNELVCKGQLLNRADYPRLWEWVQTLGGSLVSDANWNLPNVVSGGRTYPTPYIGCFSNGDGSTTFRLPNLMNSFLRGVKSEIGSDTERLLNKPGGFQEDMFEAHSHNIPTENLQGSTNINSVSTYDTHSDVPDIPTSTTGGAETRPQNVAILFTIKC